MKFTRRKFLIGTGVVGGGLVLGIALTGSDEGPVPQTVENSFQPNAWLQITTDGNVIFQLDKAEMGQNVYSALTTIIAEELDYDPAKIQVQMAPPHSAYANAALGMQVTGGSTSVNSAWLPLRNAGASARSLLMTAAAQHWGVSAEQCDTDNGYVINKHSGEKLSYGELSEAAKSLPIPEQVTLKNTKDFKWLGKSTKRLDSREKTNGSAIFGTDVDLPNLKIAVVVRCPHFGGTVKSFDAGSIDKLLGVKKVFQIHNGVAIVADSYWQARQAANQLTVEWNKGPLADLSSNKILEAQRNFIEEPDDLVEAANEGDADSAIDAASKVISAEYSAPFLHHSSMEPQNCTALVTDDSCEVWASNQAPDIVRQMAAQFGGFEASKVKVNSTFLGGGFGRRAMCDFAGEAAAIAKQVPGVPVKVMWSREDDMQHDFYRPSTLHKLDATLDDQGHLSSWRHRLASASIIKGFATTLASGYLPTWLPEAMAKGIGRLAGNFAAGADTSMAEGAVVPYHVANKKVDVALYDPGIPLGFWRSVGHSHNAFVAEGFADEMAHAANQDPVEFRLKHLTDHPRHKGVLEAVAKAANWGNPAAGRFQGVAVHESFLSYVAEVVEVSLQDSGYKIERVVCAVDCGFVVNPDNVTAQIESAVVYGLSAALKPPVTIDDGRVVQSNFHDLPVLRINEVPPIEVVLIDSQEAPTGVGEIGLPPLAPALANAIFAATGQRLRDLPLVLKS
ncbi:xanthine dehydrogenase family protein molybdopterin-binding subunit [Aurantivibrio infirmus]